MRKKLFTFLLALVTSVGLSWATVITWDQSKVSSMAMNVLSGSDSRTSDGITVTAVNTGEFVVFGDHGGAIEIGNGEGSGGGYLTFTSTVGNIAQIDINHSGAGEWRNANGDWISPYYQNFEGGIFRWSGTPAASVTLTGDAPRYIYDITSIEFTIEDGGGSEPATGLQVVEVTSDIYNGWNSNGNTFSVNALPGFQAVTFDEAKAWTEVPTSGTAVLVYRTNGDYARVIHFFDGTISGDYDLETDFNQMYENITLFGNRIFYTAGGSTPTPTPSGDEGKLLGAFTINNNGDQIVFSKGNLQYHCTNHVWQFATNQYDIIGGDNANISDSYDGWVDLFGYGTGNNPTLVSTSYGDYSTFTDWGVNAISNGGNEANLWRTLTKDELVYMFILRPEAHNKYGAATVANVPGIIVLPDVYVGPAVNTVRDAWDNNVISSSEWAAYEAAGAVFLPAAGYRSGTTMDNVGSYGFCWSSTPDDAMYSYKLSLSPNTVQPQGFGLRYEGLSVRLVKAASAQDIADFVIALINAIPNPVAYNDECKDAIDAARAAYDALTDAQKDLVENYGDLLDAETAYAQSIPHPHGECGAQGNNLLWDLDPSTGVLTITGSGAMNDWPDDTTLPWYANRLDITSVVLPSGITSIGEKAFRGCNNLASINMTGNYPAGLTAINQEAFCNTKLTSVTIPESVVTIGMDAFYLSQAITDVYCYADPNNLTWNDYYRDDFKKTPAKSTQCHVKDCHLAVYNSKWNTSSQSTDVNVTFVGDLPGDCGGSTPTGDKLPGVFSVSGTKAVNFSKGNLQYVGGNWQFADNQWDVIGASQADNSRDLFGWGTGNNPNQKSDEYEDYTTFADWGSNMGGDWRTLTRDEWLYIFNTRTSASDLRGSATVCGVNGYIILPDNFVLPGGLSWTPRPNNWNTNVYTSQEWSSMEENGAVFLPAAGYRAGTTVYYDGSAWGYYWSATEHSQAYYAYSAWVADEDSYVRVYQRDRTYGHSVRLVSETAPTPTPTDEQVPTNVDPENPSYHYSTFFHSSQNYKLSNDGTQAFIADLSNNELVLTEIAHGEQVIPANTAVILRKTGSADPVVLIPTAESGVSVNPDDNDLRGVDDATTLASLSINPAQCYVLSGKSHDESESGVGFYRIYGPTLKAHKAYVIFAGSSNNAPKKMRFVYGQATGIEDVQGNNVQSTKVIENGVLYIIIERKNHYEKENIFST